MFWLILDKEKTYDVSCCISLDIPNECLGYCSDSNPSVLFRNGPAPPPNKCDDYKEVINDKCVVGVQNNPGCSYSQINKLLVKIEMELFSVYLLKCFNMLT